MADNNNSAAKVGIGVAIGTILGGLAAFFFSPKSGKENREMVAKKYNEVKTWLEDQHVDERVQEIFGEVSAESKILYTEVRAELLKLLTEVKSTIDSFDTEKYAKLVEEAIGKTQKEVKQDVKKVEKLRAKLLKEWEHKQ